MITITDFHQYKTETLRQCLYLYFDDLEFIYDKQYWNRDNLDELIMDLSQEKKVELIDFIDLHIK